jgi:hypothetical protein
MILEGIVTTLSPSGSVNIAPMGPTIDPSWQSFTLRPFGTAQTYQNLIAHPEGVLHVTDDVLLLARAAIGPVEPLPELVPALRVRGKVLAGACRAYEFRVFAIDERDERKQMQAQVVHTWTFRDFFGFNRAKHAVIEAAILATRTHLLDLEEIDAEYKRLSRIVEKTGGPAERQAFQILEAHLDRVRAQSQRPFATKP